MEKVDGEVDAERLRSIYESLLSSTVSKTSTHIGSCGHPCAWLDALPEGLIAAEVCFTCEGGVIRGVLEPLYTKGFEMKVQFG